MPKTAHAGKPTTFLDEQHAGESPTPIPAAIDKAVEDWIREELTNSVFSASTEVWNYLQARKESLKLRVVAAVKG